MKKITFSCLFTILFTLTQAQLPMGTATLGLTLTCSGGTANRSSVAYNPNQQLYYCVNAGSSSYPIETFDATGSPVSTTNAGFDYRGSWWNPNTNSLEGNGYNTLGIWQQDLDASFYPVNTGTNVVPSTSGPNVQSNGDYDWRDDEILFYDNGMIYRHSRSTNTLISSVSITGLPTATSNLNNNSIAYTGVVGMEAGIYDHFNKAFYFINKLTGAYVAMCQLPVSAPAATTFRLGFANGYLWVFDGTARVWNGYQTISCSYTTSTLTLTACAPYTVPSGKASYTVSGNYTDTLTNAAGCDSLISINLTIANVATHDTISVTECNSYTTPSGIYTYSSSGTYEDTILNVSGCDSIITINLTINKANTTVTQSGKELSANAIGAAYQWLDCSNDNSPIAGANERTYTATANGDYSVIVTEKGCVDTSICFTVNTVGISHSANKNEVYVFPNPARENITIRTANDWVGSTLEIISIKGDVQITQLLTANQTKLNLSSLSSGIYFIKISTNENSQYLKLFKE